MKLLSLKEAEASTDADIRALVVRSSRYRIFGSPEKVPDAELVVIDLRDGKQDADFDQRFRALDRHPFFPIVLARKMKSGD